MGKVILNTDIGGDIDDVLALAMLLNSSKELLGVVTTGLDPRIKAKFARKVIAHSSKKVPVFYGPSINIKTSSYSYMTERDYAFLNRLDLDSDDHEAEIDSYGIEFLVEQINRNPGEITIISIGPNTNIAEAMRRDSNLAAKIKQIYLMAGCVSNDSRLWQVPEYNLRQDINAFNTIVKSNAKVYIVGRDFRFMIEREEIRSDGNKLTDLVVKLFNRFMTFSQKDTKWIPDPLTVGAYLFPNLYTFERIIPIVTKRGQMYGEKTDQGNIFGCIGFEHNPVKEGILKYLKIQTSPQQGQ